MRLRERKEVESKMTELDRWEPKEEAGRGGARAGQLLHCPQVDQRPGGGLPAVHLGLPASLLYSSFHATTEELRHATESSSVQSLKYYLVLCRKCL